MWGKNNHNLREPKLMLDRFSCPTNSTKFKCLFTYKKRLQIYKFKKIKPENGLLQLFFFF